jgi:hypothetical protein
MKTVELIRDCQVRHPAGTVLKVTDQEAARLAAFGLAKEKPAKKAPEKK